MKKPLLSMTGHLFYGDNLEVLRNEIKDETVDLIYLDPPFNSQATYNGKFPRRVPALEKIATATAIPPDACTFPSAT